jgi:hypothetical protein
MQTRSTVSLSNQHQKHSSHSIWSQSKPSSRKSDIHNQSVLSWFDYLVVIEFKRIQNRNESDNQPIGELLGVSESSNRKILSILTDTDKANRLYLINGDEVRYYM